MAHLINALRHAEGWAFWRQPPSHRPLPKTAPKSARPSKPEPFVEVSARNYVTDRITAWAAVRRTLQAIPCVDHFRLAPTQRNAWLVVAYDIMVRMEGHGPFFRAYGVARAGEVVVALTEIQALSTAQILSEAIHRDFAYVDDNETFTAARGLPSARLGRPPDYSDLDVMYVGRADDVVRQLDAYMASHSEHFISIDDAAEQGVEADEA